MRSAIFVLSLAVVISIAAAQGGGGGGGEGGHHHHDHHYEHSHHQYLHNKDEKKVEIKAHPKYHYEYKVADPKHHDFHGQHEVRDGHKVKGVYSLVEPDGKSTRIVEYESDHKDGFRANVKHQVHHHH